MVLCARCHLDALFVVRRGLLLTSPCVECCALVIRRGLFATSSFVEGRPLVPSFANVIGVLPLLQASEFYHVRLMKTSPKLLFIVVIVIFSILFSSRCSCLFFMESLLYTQQNIYQNIDLLKCLWNYLSNEWSFALNGVQIRELCPFHFWRCVLSRNFQSAQPSMFWPYPLVGISDWLGSWFVGTGTSWSFWISKNMLLFASEVELDIDENNIFLWIHPKMSMISIMWSLERLVVRPWLQGHHHWFTSE